MTTSNILFFFTFVWILGNYCLFPWRNNLRTKKSSSTTLRTLKIPEVNSLKTNPRGREENKCHKRRDKHTEGQQAGEMTTSMPLTPTAGTILLLAPTATSMR